MKIGHSGSICWLETSTPLIYINGGINEFVIKNVSTLGNKAAIWGEKTQNKATTKSPSNFSDAKLQTVLPLFMANSKKLDVFMLLYPLQPASNK